MSVQPAILRLFETINPIDPQLLVDALADQFEKGVVIEACQELMATRELRLDPQGNLYARRSTPTGRGYFASGWERPAVAGDRADT